MRYKYMFTMVFLLLCVVPTQATEVRLNSIFKSTVPQDNFENKELELLKKELIEYKEVISKQNELIKDISSLKDKRANEKVSIDYSVCVSILLGCVGVIITVVSVFIAIISVVGYRNFEKKIEITVRNISSKVAIDETKNQIDKVAKEELVRLIDDGALNKHLEDAVNIVFLRMGNPATIGGFDKYPEIDLEEGNNP